MKSSEINEFCWFSPSLFHFIIDFINPSEIDCARSLSSLNSKLFLLKYGHFCLHIELSRDYKSKEKDKRITREKKHGGLYDIRSNVQSCHSYYVPRVPANILLYSFVRASRGYNCLSSLFLSSRSSSISLLILVHVFWSLVRALLFAETREPR